MDIDSINFIRKTIKTQLFAVYDDYYVEEHELLTKFFENVINESISKSVLLIGPRGVGKTKILNSICEDYVDDVKVIKLNGFLHTTDKAALKSIGIQLKLEEIIEKKLTTNFSENLKLILEKSAEILNGKALIIILEEIDLFCAHYNQTLLYNLFEIAQLNKLTVLVIGVTTRLDILELFEKRVKSRFSQRRILIFPSNDFDQYFETVSNILRIKTLKQSKKISASLKDSISKWNKHIDKLVYNAAFKRVFRRLFHISNNPRTLNNFMMCVIHRLNEQNTYLTLNDFEEELRKFTKNDIIEVVRELSLMELCLLVLMKHHNEIFNKPFNFETIFKNYLKIIPSMSLNNKISQKKSVVTIAFEKIRNLEFIKPVKQRENVQREFLSYDLILMNDEIVQALQTVEDLPTGVMQWATTKPTA